MWMTSPGPLRNLKLPDFVAGAFPPTAEIDAVIGQDSAGRVFPFDSARAYAAIAASRRSPGPPCLEADCRIAAVARARGTTVATGAYPRRLRALRECGDRSMGGRPGGTAISTARRAGRRQAGSSGGQPCASTPYLVDVRVRRTSASGRKPTVAWGGRPAVVRAGRAHTFVDLQRRRPFVFSAAVTGTPGFSVITPSARRPIRLFRPQPARIVEASILAASAVAIVAARQALRPGVTVGRRLGGQAGELGS